MQNLLSQNLLSFWKTVRRPPSSAKRDREPAAEEGSGLQTPLPQKRLKLEDASGTPPDAGRTLCCLQQLSSRGTPQGLVSGAGSLQPVSNVMRQPEHPSAFLWHQLNPSGSNFVGEVALAQFSCQANGLAPYIPLIACLQVSLSARQPPMLRMTTQAAPPHPSGASSSYPCLWMSCAS